MTSKEDSTSVPNVQQTIAKILHSTKVDYEEDTSNTRSFDKEAVNQLLNQLPKDLDGLHQAYLTHLKRTLPGPDFGMLIRALKSTKTEEKEEKSYKNSNLSSKSAKNVFSSGELTFGDKIAALSVAIQDAGPVFRTKFLEVMLCMAGSVKRRESHAALQALCQVYQNPNTFNDELEWAAFFKMPFLKDAWCNVYWQVLRLCEVHAHDPVEHGREQACRLLHLLVHKDPQHSHQHPKSNLKLIEAEWRERVWDGAWAVLCSRLGDADRKLASRISWYAMQCIQACSPAKIATSDNSQKSALKSSELKEYWTACEAKGLECELKLLKHFGEATRKALITTKKQQINSKDGDEEKKDNGAQRAAHRTLHYGLSFCVQMPLFGKRKHEVAEKLLDIYGILIEHFLLGNYVRENGQKAEYRKKTGKKGHFKKDKPKAETNNDTRTGDAGKIGKLLLIGLSRCLPAIKSNSQVIQTSLVQPLMKLLEKDRLAAKKTEEEGGRVSFAVICQAIFMLHTLHANSPLMTTSPNFSPTNSNNFDFGKMIRERLLHHPQLATHTSMHMLITKMIGQLASNNQEDLRKEALALAALGILQAPAASNNMEVFGELLRNIPLASLTIPEDPQEGEKEDGQNNKKKKGLSPLWIVSLIGKHWDPACRAMCQKQNHKKEIIADNNTGMSNSAWLASWVELKGECSLRHLYPKRSSSTTSNIIKSNDSDVDALSDAEGSFDDGEELDFDDEESLVGFDGNGDESFDESESMPSNFDSQNDSDDQQSFPDQESSMSEVEEPAPKKKKSTKAAVFAYADEYNQVD